MMGNTGNASDFYEDDESTADVLAAFEAGERGVTRRPGKRPGVRIEGVQLVVARDSSHLHRGGGFKPSRVSAQVS